jgi:hypothetical protein
MIATKEYGWIKGREKLGGDLSGEYCQELR